MCKVAGGKVGFCDFLGFGLGDEVGYLSYRGRDGRRLRHVDACGEVGFL